MSARRVVTLVADAAPTLGAGHVMRCLTLGHALARLGLHVRLSSSALPSALCERASHLDVEVATRSRAASEPAVVAEILDRGTDAVVLDSYEVGAEVVHELQQRVGVVAIDDEREAPLGHPLAVINQNLHADLATYADLPATTVRMLGPEWALVRPEVVAWRERAPRRHGDVLTALGGADIRSLTPAIVAALSARGLEPIAATGLVAGSSTVAADPGRFAEALASCRLAVIGAGTTVWECLCLGTPAVALVTADNQRTIAEVGVREQLLHAAFDVRTSTPVEAVADAALDLHADAARRAHLRDAGQRVVDGQGAARAADVVAELFK
jgi:spore coat polysaccharide biosynthesis predicted glycosyltransferase SpsG